MIRASVLSIVVCLGLAGLWACGHSEPSDLVGVWTDSGDSFRFEFRADGSCLYRMGHHSEYFVQVIVGTYERVGPDALRIHLDHPVAGEYKYLVDGDLLQLTDARGQRTVFRRLAESAESHTFGFVPACSTV